MATRADRLRPGRLRGLVADVAADFAKDDLLTYSSAIAFRALVALVPLTLLALGLLGAFGLRDVWSESIAPFAEERVSTPVFAAIDFSVERLLGSGTTGLIAFAAALLVWDMAWAMNAVMKALNTIRRVKERRSWPRRILTAVALAVAVSACFVGAVLAVTAGPRARPGLLDVPLAIGGWAAAVALLLLAVGLLIRYAPAERPDARWATAGSIFVVVVWIVASLAFKWWVTAVADFDSAVGALTMFLVLTAYVLVSSAIFLVGVQIDEVAQRAASGGRRPGR